MSSRLVAMGSAARSRRFAFLFAAVTVAGVLGVVAIGAGYGRQIAAEDARRLAERELSPYASSLAASVNTRFALVTGLHEYVRSTLPEGPDRDRFNVFAAGLGAGASGIRAIQVAPGGVVDYIFPVEGNVAPGNDLLNDPRPEVRADALRTKDSDHIVLSGPYELRQGGLGIIGRQSVRTASGEFWGFVIMVLDVPPIIEEAGLDASSAGLVFAIRDANGHVFAGDAGVFDQSPVTFTIDLPDGTWELAAVPTDGWDAAVSGTSPWIWGVGVILASALGTLAFLVVSYERRLRLRVDEQTAELRYQQQLLQDIGAIAHIGGWEFDPATGEGTWTDETARIHGVDPAAPTSVALGVSFYMEDSRLQVEQAIADAAENGTDYDLELEMVAATGEHRWVRTMGHPTLEDGKVVRIRGSFQDITAQKLAQMELVSHREHLEELVEQRTEQLQSMNRELDAANADLMEANRAKSEFLASMSHELRTPLNSIIGFSDMLARGVVGPLEEEQIKQISIVNTSGRHLLALINDVLDLSKVEAGAVELQVDRFDARATLLEVAEVLRPLAEAKGIELEVVVPDTECPASTDEGKVRQILLNLGGNAIKFTPSGRVDLRLDCDGEIAELSVKDTGVGIPSGELKRVFEVFAQIERSGEVKPPGTGLGLALSRRYAELLGGRIVVESDVGRGSTFTLVLPCSVQ